MSAIGAYLRLFGPYESHLTARIARHAAMFMAAACALFFVFEAVEMSRADLSFFDRAAGRLPEVIARVAKLALLLAGTTAGHGAV
ncbi:MAG: hypothetical protein AAF449_10445, partial [Myxococcota bacterium]